MTRNASVTHATLAQRWGRRAALLGVVTGTALPLSAFLRMAELSTMALVALLFAVVSASAGLLAVGMRLRVRRQELRMAAAAGYGKMPGLLAPRRGLHFRPIPRHFVFSPEQRAIICRRWLQRAPVIESAQHLVDPWPIDLQALPSVLDLEDAVRLFVQMPRFSPKGITFTEVSRRGTPSGYQKALKWHSGWGDVYMGNVNRLHDGRVVLTWYSSRGGDALES